MARRSTRCQALLVALVGVGVLVLPVQARGESPSGDAPTDAEARLELGRLYHEQVFQSLDRAIAEYQAAVCCAGCARGRSPTVTPFLFVSYTAPTLKK